MPPGPYGNRTELVQCSVPRLDLIGRMLIGSVVFREDRQGRRTESTVAPPAAFAPEPITTASAGVGAGGWSGTSQPAAGTAGTPSGARVPST